MDDILDIIQKQSIAEAIRVTQHARQEMVDELITLDEVLAAIADGQILEDYPEHQRGACCLLYGRTRRSSFTYCLYNKTTFTCYYYRLCSTAS